MRKWSITTRDIEGDYEIIKKYEEPKTGHWKLSEDGEHGICSECGAGYFDLVGGQIYVFCPTCGAKMEE